MNAAGQVLSRLEQPTDARRGSAATLATLQDAIRATVTRFDRIAAIGVACAGEIRPDGLVVRAPNLGWRDVPLGATLAKAFSVPVVVENDVRAAAWGEFCFGAGRGTQSLIAVFVGTGVGSGAVLDGRLWRGAGNAAGEIGHTQVVPDGLPCGCGRRGCLEQYVSGGGFQRRFATALETGVETRLNEDARCDPAGLTAAMVAVAAEAGDAFARQIWRDATRYLTMALANYVTIMNPQALVLGGGVIETVPALVETVATGIAAGTTVLAGESIRIGRAQLGDWSGVVGAAALTTTDTETASD